MICLNSFVVAVVVVVSIVRHILAHFSHTHTARINWFSIKMSKRPPHIVRQNDYAHIAILTSVITHSVVLVRLQLPSSMFSCYTIFPFVVPLFVFLARASIFISSHIYHVNSRNSIDFLEDLK